MNITAILDEKPFPPNHGGRVDNWRRLQAFASEGVKIQLIFWHAEGDAPDPESVQALGSVAESIHAFEISRSWIARFRTLILSRNRSLYVATRELRKETLQMLQNAVDGFSPDAVWIDGLFAAPLGLKIAERSGLPAFFRPHNVESEYRQIQYERSAGIRAKAAAWLAKRNIANYELEVMNRATHIWDISLDGVKFWREKGITNIDWLPPFIDPELTDQLNASTERDFDLAYLGNLYTPNNMEGIKWFIFDVWPKITRKADVRCLFAGSNPDSQILKWAQNAGITVIPNAESASEIYSRAKILINPILSGSGMNVKSVEMLASGKPVVTCPQGVAGMPEDVRQCFLVAASADEFADLCLTALESSVRRNCSENVISKFAFSAIRPVLDEIRRHI